MSRHAGNFTTGVLAGAVCLAGSLGLSAIAEAASPPDFAPNPSVGWFAYSREFIPPRSGAGPVRQDPAHPHVSNDDFRVTGRQPTFAMGDPDNPILKPWAAEKIRRRNALILAGKPDFSPHASCWPIGVTQFLLSPMTRPLYFVQGPKEVVMILTSFNDVRRIHLTDKHSQNVKPSWYGESIGHYEGDALVVDTIGFNGKAFVDRYGTPYSEQLHMIERYSVSADGKALQAEVTYDDPKAYSTQWKALIKYHRGRDLPVEVACAESAIDPVTGKLNEIPIAEKPDF